MELCQVQRYAKQTMQGGEEREPFKSQSALEPVAKQEVLLWTRVRTSTSHHWEKHLLCWAHGPNRAQVNVCGKGTCFHGHKETLCYAAVVTVL